jgi:hypothetical protein
MAGQALLGDAGERHVVAMDRFDPERGRWSRGPSSAWLPIGGCPAKIAARVPADDRQRFESLRRWNLDPTSTVSSQRPRRFVGCWVKGRVLCTGAANKERLGFVLDITKHKLAEQALAHSEPLVDVAR